MMIIEKQYKDNHVDVFCKNDSGHFIGMISCYYRPNNHVHIVTSFNGILCDSHGIQSLPVRTGVIVDDIGYGIDVDIDGTIEILAG